MNDRLYQKKIRKMIFSRVVMLPVALLLLVCAVIVFYFISYSGKEVENRLQRIAVDHRDMIDSFLREKSRILQLISLNYTYESINEKQKLQIVFNNLQSLSRAFIDMGVFNEQGNHIAYAGPFNLEGKNYSDAKWFKMVKDNDIYISDEFLGYRKIPHFVIAVKKVEKEKTWYLRATIDTLFFNNLVDSIRIGRTGHAYIINKEGVLKGMHQPGKTTFPPDLLNQMYETKSNEAVTFFQEGFTGFKYVYCTTPLNQTDWFLVVRQESLDAYFPLFITAIISVIIIIAGGTAVIVTGYLMASNMANRLKIADAEKREMKTQLIIAGKLAEVGEMSTGIAHEINNPLQIIKSETAMMDLSLDEIEKTVDTSLKEETDTLRDCLDQIKLQVTRCGSITRGLLSFARKNEGNFETIGLSDLIPEIVHMVDEKARVENIKIVQDIQEELPYMTTDPSQLQQVFLNLLNNSIYALKDKPQGEIRITVRQQEQNASITIADNGCGFKKEEIEKAFVPFFTTKPVGQGTGLGLSTVYGIIKGLGGDMSLDSEYMQGAVFSITLPFNQQKKQS